MLVFFSVLWPISLIFGCLFYVFEATVRWCNIPPMFTFYMVIYTRISKCIRTSRKSSKARIHPAKEKFQQSKTVAALPYYKITALVYTVLKQICIGILGIFAVGFWVVDIRFPYTHAHLYLYETKKISLIHENRFYIDYTSFHKQHIQYIMH